MNDLCTLLLPELDTEFGKTRKVLANIPDQFGDFRSHPKSRTLSSLAGHTADLVSFIVMVLTRPEFDFGTDHRTPPIMQSRTQLLQVFDESAVSATEALRRTSDHRFQSEFRFLFNGRVVFQGSCYTAYRINCLDHLIHHRAQLGIYLRLLGASVPATYGPSADETY